MVVTVATGFRFEGGFLNDDVGRSEMLRDGALGGEAMAQPAAAPGRSAEYVLLPTDRLVRRPSSGQVTPARSLKLSSRIDEQRREFMRSPTTAAADLSNTIER